MGRRSRKNDAGHSGALIIDKPSRMTSHDVVSRVRRVLQMRRVGHAGTLDPMATGVLVVMVGEATKLAAFLTAEDKRYTATVQLGRATDTLDREGVTTATAPLHAEWLSNGPALLESALVLERVRTLQQPPLVSAIKVDGRSAHKRFRAGEDVSLPKRAVAVRSLRAIGVLTAEGSFELDVHVAKGYYVRSLARDLGEHLGIPAHLSELRRHSSGVFTTDDAISFEALSEPGGAERALISMPVAASRALGSACFSVEGAARARLGAVLSDADFDDPPPFAEASDGETAPVETAPVETAPMAWLDPDGELVAIGRRLGDGTPRVKRVFMNAPEQDSGTQLGPQVDGALPGPPALPLVDDPSSPATPTK